MSQSLPLQGSIGASYSTALHRGQRPKPVVLAVHDSSIVAAGVLVHLRRNGYPLVTFHPGAMGGEGRPPAMHEVRDVSAIIVVPSDQGSRSVLSPLIDSIPRSCRLVIVGDPIDSSIPGQVVVPTSADMNAIDTALTSPLAMHTTLTAQSIRRQRKDPIERIESLSERELLVLRHLVAGHPSSLMATRLGISPHTLRTHIANVLAKLGVQSRLEAGAVGRRMGVQPATAVIPQ